MRTLYLPGINPSTRLLEQVSPAALFDVVVDYAWRLARQWKLADWVRDRLASLGIVLEDGKDGTTWRSR